MQRIFINVEASQSQKRAEKFLSVHFGIVEKWHTLVATTLTLPLPSLTSIPPIWAVINIFAAMCSASFLWSRRTYIVDLHFLRSNAN